MRLIDTSRNRSWVPGGHAGSLSRELLSSAHGATQVTVHTSTIAPGGSSELEQHPASEQLFVMLSGELTFIDAEGHELQAEPGTAVFVPIGDPHATANRGSEDAVCMVITAPPLP